MNKRNNTYIKEFNPEKGIRLANNKNQTKKFLTQRGIPVPQTLVHLKTTTDWLEFDF
jgi:glutathione synthase/RimK-type ligase-like ATP-grasp enzyme